MSSSRSALCLSVILTGLIVSSGTSQAQVNVLTRNYNNQRTGANLSETVLNTSNVNASQFGKLYLLPVDDQVYAGILYVSNLSIAGGTHNVIFVETTNNTVYAFDADTFGDPLWQRNFNGDGRPTHNNEVGQACGSYRDFVGNGDTGTVANIGIVGTPVIDGDTNTMYFVSRTVEGTDTVHRLNAIDITTGDDRDGSPQIIQASVPGTGAGTDGTNVAFNPITANQRPGVALSGDVVYIGWSSFCDTGPYHGWFMAYDKNSLAQIAAYNDTPNGSNGGIWHSGAAPAFDANGNVYLGTGNGSFNPANQTEGGGFGQTLLKFSPSLARLDFFTPSNFNMLNNADWDFGSQGPVMLPGTNLFVTGGKEGKLYLLNTQNLGGFVTGDTQIPQSFQVVDTTVRPNATHHLHNAMPVWNSPQGLNVYAWGENDFLHAYRFNTSTQKLTLPAFANGSILPPIGMPGGMMVVSANGSQAGSGILWASIPRAGDANQDTVPGNLFAFNAENLALLWSSGGPGDDTLNFAKGSPPLVANGRVYLASISGFVSVYGLKTSSDPVISQNLALNKPATGTAPCDPSQTADKAFDGSTTTKWCSSAANPFIQVDLGANYSLSRFIVEHASAGGESAALNSRDFTIQVSVDNVNFATVVNASRNTYGITTHNIPPTTARYVRLSVVAPSTANIYEFQVYGSPAPDTPDFQLSVSPGLQTIVTGGSTSFTATVTGFNGFADSLDLSASGLPDGVSATFNPPSGSGSFTSTLNISSSSTIRPGSYPFTITASAAGLTHSTSASLIVNLQSAGSLPLDSSTPYNILAIAADNVKFSGGGMIGSQGGAAYSATFLGRTQVVSGISFHLGPPHTQDSPPNPLAMNAWRGGTVLLPAGSAGFSTLGMLATAYNGNKPNRVFTITYTDNTTSSVVQSISDWFTPQSYAGETIASVMPYRNYEFPLRDDRPFQLFAYFLPLNSAKTVKSITLPSGDIVALAFTLLKTPDFQVSVNPASQIIAAGDDTSFTVTVTGSNGFADPVDLSVTGLPPGASATFTPSSASGGSGDSTLSISTSPDQPGTFPLLIAGSAGALRRTALATLQVNGTSNGAVPVNAASLYDTMAITTDGKVFTGGLGGAAFSAALLGSSQTLNGIPFQLGPPDQNDSWSGNSPIPLPSGHFATLGMFATSVGGNSTNQFFAVTYTDNTTDYLFQSVSDWFTPQNFSGETTFSMAYRNLANGTKDNRTFNAYASFFPIDPTKTVRYLTCPTGCGNVTILSLTLVPSRALSAPDFSVSASPSSLVLDPGSSSASTVSLDKMNGFAEGVHFTAHDLPEGVRASFTPDTTTGTSMLTLTLAPDANVQPGLYRVTVEGESEESEIEHTTTIALYLRASASSIVGVDLSSSFLRTGFTTDFVPFSGGGLDGGGSALSANLLLGSPLTSQFDFGPADAPDAVPSAGQPISLPATHFSALKMVATGLQGAQRNQVLKVTYTDGTSDLFTQSFNDWFGVSPTLFPGETRALGMAYRNNSNGSRDNRTFNAFGYSFALNNSKAVKTITLPNNANVEVLAITLVP